MTSFSQKAPFDLEDFLSKPAPPPYKGPKGLRLDRAPPTDLPDEELGTAPDPQPKPRY